MSPILDLLNRLFLADPTRALEIVTHMFEQHTRDIRFWRDKYERANEDGAEISQELTNVEAQSEALSKIAAERFNRITLLEEQARVQQLLEQNLRRRIDRLENRLVECNRIIDGRQSQ